MKTSGRAPAADEIIRNLTLTAHTMAYRKLTGRIESGVGLDVLVSTRLPKLISVMAQIAQEDIDQLTAVIAGVATAVQAGNIYPNPSQILCSQKYCGYYQECRNRYRKFCA